MKYSALAACNLFFLGALKLSGEFDIAVPIRPLVLQGIHRALRRPSEEMLSTLAPYVVHCVRLRVRVSVHPAACGLIPPYMLIGSLDDCGCD